jgi:hypothetical protein
MSIDRRRPADLIGRKVIPETERRPIGLAAANHRLNTLSGGHLHELMIQQQKAEVADAS